MCGILALFLADEEASCCGEIYEGLNVLQHRGQEAAGMMTGKGARLYQCKGFGLAKEVFNVNTMPQLQGNMGVAQVKYPSARPTVPAEVAPFYVNSPYGLSLSLEGNIVNAEELRYYLSQVAHRHVNTLSNAEVFVNIFADELQQVGKERVHEEDIFQAASKVYQNCRGAFSCVAMIAGYGIMAMRDPHGIRPLVYGKRMHPNGTVDYLFASESVALDTLGFTLIGDVTPGECILVTRSGLSIRKCSHISRNLPCPFEYIYFGRPDSIIEGITVYHARLRMGEELAKVVRALPLFKEVEVVIPVPDAGRICSLQCAQALGKPYREGFIKNRYVGNPHPMPFPAKGSVKRKLNAMPPEFEGRAILLVDDSIIRGTTSKEVIKMARDAGARKVFFACCSPPIRFQSIYGFETPPSEELIAYNRNANEIAFEMGADAVVYLVDFSSPLFLEL